MTHIWKANSSSIILPSLFKLYQNGFYNFGHCSEEGDHCHLAQSITDKLSNKMPYCLNSLAFLFDELVLLELHEIALSEGGRRGWYKQSWPDVSTPCYLPIYILPHFPNPSLDNRKVDESGWKYPQCYMHLWLTNRVPRVNQRLCRCLLTFQRKNCDHSEIWEGVFGQRVTPFGKFRQRWE